MRLALALALLALCAGVQAEDRELRHVPVSEQHDPLYLDPATVLRSGTQVSFRYVLDVPVAFDVPGRPRRWRSNEAAAVIDCARNTYSIEKVVAYAGPAGSGEIVGRHSGNAAEREPAPIVRDSTFDYLARYVCR